MFYCTVYVHSDIDHQSWPIHDKIYYKVGLHTKDIHIYAQEKTQSNIIFMTYDPRSSNNENQQMVENLEANRGIYVQ